MGYHECKRCKCIDSVFWHRYSYGCDINGNGGYPFELCDDCSLLLKEFMKGR